MSARLAAAAAADGRGGTTGAMVVGWTAGDDSCVRVATEPVRRPRTDGPAQLGLARLGLTQPGWLGLAYSPVRTRLRRRLVMSAASARRSPGLLRLLRLRPGSSSADGDAKPPEPGPASRPRSASRRRQSLAQRRPPRQPVRPGRAHGVVPSGSSAMPAPEPRQQRKPAQRRGNPGQRRIRRNAAEAGSGPGMPPCRPARSPVREPPRPSGRTAGSPAPGRPAAPPIASHSNVPGTIRSTR